MDGQTAQLIQSLQGQLEQLREENRQLREENKQLRRRVEELERAAARQAAPFRRPEGKKKPASERKRPGRPAGHAGARRPVPDHVDETIDVPLDHCPQCRGSVEVTGDLEQYIEEIPPIRPRVTRLITHRGRCACCGDVASTHPLQTSRGQGAAKVQLGPRALALAAWLNKACGLTMRNTCGVLRQLLGLKFSPGGLAQAVQRVARRVKGDYEKLIDELRAAPAVHADETSWWVGGPGHWLWVFTHPALTVYHVDASRGSDVVRQMLGDGFAGMLVSDCLASYNPGDYRKHKCIAHHLRAIADAMKKPDTNDLDYLNQWKTFFKAVCVLYRLRELLGDEAFTAKRQHLHETCDELLARPVEQSGDVAVRNRLLKQRAHLLGCLDEPAAAPTNNLAERQLRPAVIARKLSCGNKTPAGRDAWQILASLAATCTQRGTDFIHHLTNRLPLTAVG